VSLRDILQSVDFIDSHEELVARTSALGKELLGRMRAAGVDTSRPIDLEPDTSGHVRVVNDHPDKAKIEAVFEADEKLANEFRLLSNTASLFRAAAEHLRFAEAHARDPAAAMVQFAHLFDGQKRDQSIMRLKDDILNAVFSDTPRTISS
jgi:hypothetical protein